MASAQGRKAGNEVEAGQQLDFRFLFACKKFCARRRRLSSISGNHRRARVSLEMLRRNSEEPDKAEEIRNQNDKPALRHLLGESGLDGG